MTEHLQVLHYNVGRQRHVQWSMLNDEAYARFAVLAIVEPHLYADRTTGQQFHNQGSDDRHESALTHLMAVHTEDRRHMLEVKFCSYTLKFHPSRNSCHQLPIVKSFEVNKLFAAPFVHCRHQIGRSRDVIVRPSVKEIAEDLAVREREGSLISLLYVFAKVIW